MFVCYLLFLVLIPATLIQNGLSKSLSNKKHHSQQNEMNLAEAEMIAVESGAIDRNAIHRYASSRWRTIDSATGRVLVPYKISANFTEGEIAVIRNAVDAIANNTCVDYTSLDDHSIPDWDGHYVDFIEEAPGCSAHIGRLPEMRNRINLDRSKNYYCLKFKHVIHEMLHVLGLDHEQSRPDSEDYIIVHYNNIKPDYHGNFKPDKGLVTYGLPYDYTSIMHYNDYAFAINSSEVVIETKDPKYQKIIGTAAHPSDIDYQKVCAIYMCSECVGRPFVPPPETVNSTQASVNPE